MEKFKHFEVVSPETCFIFENKFSLREFVIKSKQWK